MLRAGDVLAGRYRIEEPLGQGGMGLVFRGADLRLNRAVAIKVMHVDARADVATLSHDRIRFVREAEASARLVHPNIVTLFDVGETDDGTPFLVMELATGVPLHRMLPSVRDGAGPAVPLDQRLRWLVDIANGVAAAHRAGIVHRDLKPSNVFVTPEGAKILDFGVARLSGAATLTVEGFQPGTPRYMAPEQLAGARVDVRADQYAWGLIAHQLLTGALPAAGVEPFHGHAAAAPPAVVAIVRRALHPSPEGRFPSMDEIVTALAALVTSSAAPPPPQRSASAERSPARPTRRPVGVFVGACAVTLFVGAAGAAWLVRRSTATATSVRANEPVESPSTAPPLTASAANAAPTEDQDASAPSQSAAPDEASAPDASAPDASAPDASAPRRPSTATIRVYLDAWTHMRISDRPGGEAWCRERAPQYAQKIRACYHPGALRPGQTDHVKILVNSNGEQRGVNWRSSNANREVDPKVAECLHATFVDSRYAQDGMCIFAVRAGP